jgi:hypothetical protein
MTAILQTDEQATEQEILEQFAKLGHLLATPAISKAAEARRAWAIAATNREIIRLQRVLIDLLREGRAE